MSLMHRMHVLIYNTKTLVDGATKLASCGGASKAKRTCLKVASNPPTML